MIKLTFCLHRLPNLSRAEFQSYWRNTHAPLVARHQKALRIRRYVQSHAITHDLNEAIRTSRTAPQMYDGVALLWWDSLADIEAALNSTEGRIAGAALLDDERKFIDLARSPLWFGQDHEIF
ncbi:MAG: EthD domain-containing protein [Alphaproteobacteria bacterium]|nr:EthD domain-containing protein [Alphaproteobacteria bacterium]